MQVLAASDQGRIRMEEIAAHKAISFKEQDTIQYSVWLAALQQRQMVKMNQPVFWIIICVMMGPPALLLWGVSIYNFLWWEHGIWPQLWSIADFPPSIKPWAQAAIDWLYDPMGPPGTVVGAAIAGRLTAGR